MANGYISSERRTMETLPIGGTSSGYSGFGQMGSQNAFVFGGGNIGPSPSFFQFRNPTFQERMIGRMQPTAELKQEFRGRPNPITGQMEGGINLLPAGALSRQEIRNRPEVQQVLQSRGAYVEAPTQYTLQNDQRGLPKYVNPLTGQSLGTMSASWAGSSTPPEEMKRREESLAKGLFWTGRPKRGGPQPEQQTGTPFTPPERSLGTSAESPLAFTGFGRTIGESAYMTPTIPPITPSPIPKRETEMLTSFGGIPRFPFAGY